MAEIVGDTYIVNRTDPSNGYYTVSPNARVGAKGGNPIRGSEPDIRFYGRKTQDWGEGTNENFLRLLENFACPETPGTSAAPVPQNENYLGNGYGINNPVKGQLWYNTTQNQLFVFNGEDWDDLCCGSSGTIGPGEPIDPTPEEIECCVGFGGPIGETGPGGGYGGDPIISPTECCGYGSMGGTIEGEGTTVDLSQYVRKSGDVMSGALILAQDPVTSLEASTKRYVDNAILSIPSTNNSLSGLDDVSIPAPQVGHVLTYTGTTWVSAASGGGSITSGSIPSVKDYGALGDGVADDTTAFYNAIQNTKILYVPPGRYRLTSPLPKHVDNDGSFFMFGAGPESTHLSFVGVNEGFVVTLDEPAPTIREEDFPYGVGFSNMSIETSITAAGAAISVFATASEQPNNGVVKVFENLSISGNQSSDYWNYGINLIDVSNVTIRNVQYKGAASPTIQGTGINISASTSVSTSHVVSDLRASTADKAINVDGLIEDVRITNVNAMVVNYGVYVSGTANEHNFDVTNSNISSKIAGVMLENVATSRIVNNTFGCEADSNVCVSLLSPLNTLWNDRNTFLVTNNIMYGDGYASTTGILVDQYSQTVVIDNNMIYGQDVGIELTADSREVLVGSSNNFTSNATDYNDGNPTYNTIQVIPAILPIPSDISDLNDVDTTGVAIGDKLEFNGTNWVPVQLSIPNDASDLSDVDTTGAATGDLLEFNGTNWVPVQQTGIRQILMANNATVKTMTAAASAWTVVVSISITKVDGTDIAIQANGSLTGFNDTVDLIECEGTIGRDTTAIGDVATTDVTAGTTDEMTHGIGLTYIDSGQPAGSYTYSVMIRGIPQGATTITDQAYGSNWSLTVMEIR